MSPGFEQTVSAAQPAAGSCPEFAAIPEFTSFQKQLAQMRALRAQYGPGLEERPTWNLPKDLPPLARQELCDASNQLHAQEISFYQAWTKKTLGSEFRGLYLLACMDAVDFLCNYYAPGSTPVKLGHWDYVDIGYLQGVLEELDPGRLRLQEVGIQNPQVLPSHHFGGDSGWQHFEDLEWQATQAARHTQSIRCVHYGVRSRYSEADYAALPKELSECPYDLILFNYVQSPGEWELCRRLLRPAGYLVTRMDPAAKNRECPEFDPRTVFKPLLSSSVDCRFSLLQRGADEFN